MRVILAKITDGSLLGLALFVAICGGGALLVTGVLMLLLPW